MISILNAYEASEASFKISHGCDEYLRQILKVSAEIFEAIAFGNNQVDYSPYLHEPLYNCTILWLQSIGYEVSYNMETNTIEASEECKVPVKYASEHITISWPKRRDIEMMK